jgi:hypothetical protein
MAVIISSHPYVGWNAEVPSDRDVYTATCRTLCGWEISTYDREQAERLAHRHLQEGCDR